MGLGGDKGPAMFDTCRELRAALIEEGAAVSPCYSVMQLQLSQAVLRRSLLVFISPALAGYASALGGGELI